MDSREEKGNIIILDTNILIDDPETVVSTRTGANASNLVVVPWTVILELDKNKSRLGIGHEVREAVRLIKKALKDPNSNLIIEHGTYYPVSNLDKSNPDHQIIGTVAFISKQTNPGKKSVYSGYQKIKFLTNDEILQTLAGHIFRSNAKLLIEPLLKNRVKEVKIKPLRKIKLGPEEQKVLAKGAIHLNFDKKLRLKENEIVMFVSAFDASGQEAELKTHFLGIKKGSRLKIIKPDVKVFEHGALNNGKTNWLQVAAIEMLKDPEINVVFLQGGAGSGKTFLALAGGLEAKKAGKCNKVVIMRLPVPLDSKHFTGTLPGDVESKHAPWLLPIIDNLTALCPKSRVQIPTKSYDEANFSLLAQHNIAVQPLDYIKGSSFRDSYIIIEEAQDLTPRQIKQIITRVGKGTKIVFTGDLDQISEDDRHINRNNSGLPYAVSRLSNEPMVGIITFENVVRSPVAALAERKL